MQIGLFFLWVSIIFLSQNFKFSDFMFRCEFVRIYKLAGDSKNLDIMGFLESAKKVTPYVRLL